MYDPTPAQADLGYRNHKMNCIPGQIFDERYLVEAVLGSGGMGSVYKAIELNLDRTVAIKVLHGFQIVEQGALERFKREGRVLSKLSHRHIICFYRYGISVDGHPYIVMEYVSGPSLRAVLQEQRTMSWQRTASLGVQICEALEYAHRQGMLHRDLKPENLMLTDDSSGFVKIVDFGLAKLLASEESDLQKLSTVGQFLGTLEYASPEQCLGRTFDKRSDVYSLGCVLYEMLLGFTPFTAANPINILQNHLNQEPEPFKNSPIHGIPEGFQTIVFHALAKQPEERYQSAADLGRDLSLLLEGRLDVETISSVAGRDVRASSAHKGMIAVLVALALAFCVVLGLLSHLMNVHWQQGSRLKNSAKVSTSISDEQNQRIKRLQKRLRLVADGQERHNLAKAMVVDCLESAALHRERGQYGAADEDYRIGLVYVPLSGSGQEISFYTRYGDFLREKGDQVESEKYFCKAQGLIECASLALPQQKANLMAKWAMLNVDKQEYREAKKRLLIAERIWHDLPDLSDFSKLHLTFPTTDNSAQVVEIFKRLEQSHAEKSANIVDALSLADDIAKYLLSKKLPQAQDVLAYSKHLREPDSASRNEPDHEVPQSFGRTSEVSR